LRMLRSSPAFTAVVLLTVALGVGSNTSMFAVVYAALVRALPYPDSSRIVIAEDQSPGLFLDWRAQSGAFASVAALRRPRFALNGQPFMVVGVMPPGFDFPSPCLMWVPPRHVVPEYPLRPEADATQMRGSHYIGVYGRLKPGVTLQQAQSERRLIFTQLMRRYPDEVSQEDVDAALIPLREWLIGDLRAPLPILLATVGRVRWIAGAP